MRPPRPPSPLTTPLPHLLSHLLSKVDIFIPLAPPSFTVHHPSSFLTSLDDRLLPTRIAQNRLLYRSKPKSQSKPCPIVVRQRLTSTFRIREGESQTEARPVVCEPAGTSRKKNHRKPAERLRKDTEIHRKSAKTAEDGSLASGHARSKPVRWPAAIHRPVCECKSDQLGFPRLSYRAKTMTDAASGDCTEPAPFCICMHFSLHQSATSCS